MTKELNLDVKQQEKMKQLLPSKARATQKAEMKKKREQAKEKRSKMDEKMNAILTPTSG
jgi:Spy/CpxP family protein refolding chaperone